MLTFNRANQIKFRIWNIEKKKMESVHYINFLQTTPNSKDDGKIYDVWVEHDNGQLRNLLPNKTEGVLMQYLNNDDCDKQELYECDIVESTLLGQNKHVILWNVHIKGFSSFTFEEITHFKSMSEIQLSNYLSNKPSISNDFIIQKGFKIIGNIFENAQIMGADFDWINFLYS